MSRNRTSTTCDRRAGDEADESIVTDIGNLFRPLLGRLGWADSDWSKGQHEANARYIARARTLLPELARIVALQRRALEAVAADWDCRCDGCAHGEACRVRDSEALVRAALAGEEETR